MPQVTITVRPNGSLKVDDPNGVVEMVDADGNKYDLTGKTAFSLCRCGASANRPFCDGSHKRIAFQAPDTAIKPDSAVNLNPVVNDTAVNDTAVNIDTAIKNG